MFTDLESSSDPENQVQDYYGQDSNDSPLSSKASSVSMDDYLRRLFTACDTDNDGYLDRGDLEEVCKQLGIEENISEIIEQLGGGSTGKISYEDFCHNKSQLLCEMSTGGQGQTSSSDSNSAPEFLTDTECNINMSSSGGGDQTKPQKEKINENKVDRNGRKIVSQAQRMMTSNGASSSAQQNTNRTEYLDTSTLKHLQLIAGPSHPKDLPKGTDFLELANRINLAALEQLKDEISEINSRLDQVTNERDGFRGKLYQLGAEKQKMQKEYEERLQSQMMRVTELQSVIAELTRKLNEATGNKIIEEDEEIEESQCSSDLEGEGFSNRSDGTNACSDCSCGEAECDHHAIDDGPNQVNFLATTNEVIEAEARHPDQEAASSSGKKDDEGCFDELSRVIGALECTIADRKKTTKVGDVVDGPLQIKNEMIIEKVSLAEKRRSREICLEKSIEHSRQELHALEEQKRVLQQEIQQINVEDYLNRRSADSAVQEEISSLHKDKDKLRGKLRKAEQELEELKAANITVREEREQLRKKTRVLQDALERRTSNNQSPILSPSPTPSTGSNRTSSLPRQSTYSNSDPRRASQQSIQNSNTSPFTPVPSKKYAGSPGSTLNRQKNNIGTSSDLGSSVGDEFQPADFSETLVRCLRSRIPETLLQSLVTYNKLDQVLVSLHAHYKGEVAEKSRELELQIEHLSSKLSHLKSQNDLLQLCLEESKGNCERLSLLVAKYESKDTALAIALQNTDQIIETYEVMLQLQESEQGMLVASYRSTVQPFNTDTMKSLTSTNSSKSNVSGASSLTSNSHYQLTYADDLPDEEEGIAMFHNSQTKRRDAETHAKNLLQKLDRKYEVTLTGHSLIFDDSIDFNSRTSTLSSANSSNLETLSKEEEMRLKEYVQLLKTERSTVQTTVVELESVTDVLEPFDDSNIESGEKGSLDLETAVLLQELQALKEERAELKHRIYMLEKERKAMELKLSSIEAQGQGYIAHIEYLKSEIKEQRKQRQHILKEERRLRGSGQEDDGQSSASGNTTPAITLAELRTSEEDIPQDLYEAARREKKLKSRIQELVDTLEKLSKNSEIRHQQTAEYIGDLKRANGALVSAYEKAKKRHASRLKKFEAQLITMAEKNQFQTRLLKEKIANLEENQKSRKCTCNASETARNAAETSL